MHLLSNSQYDLAMINFYHSLPGPTLPYWKQTMSKLALHKPDDNLGKALEIQPEKEYRNYLTKRGITDLNRGN